MYDSDINTMIIADSFQNQIVLKALSKLLMICYDGFQALLFDSSRLPDLLLPDLSRPRKFHSMCMDAQGVFDRLFAAYRHLVVRRDHCLDFLITMQIAYPDRYLLSSSVFWSARRSCHRAKFGHWLHSAEIKKIRSIKRH